MVQGVCSFLVQNSFEDMIGTSNVGGSESSSLFEGVTKKRQNKNPLHLLETSRQLGQVTYIGWHHAPEGRVKVSGHSSGRLLPTIKLFRRRRAREGHSLPGIPLLPLTISGCISPRVISFHWWRGGPQGRATLLRRPVLHVRAGARAQIPSSALSPTSNIWYYKGENYFLELEEIKKKLHVWIEICKSWMWLQSGSLTLRPETGTWSIGFLLWTVTFLHFTSCLQAWELLVKLAANTQSSYNIISTWLWLYKY